MPGHRHAPPVQREPTDEISRQRAEIYALHARFCQALGDPKRLIIINALRHGERTVSELIEATGARQTNVSQHLALMRNLGLVEARREDGNVYYQLTDHRIAEAVDLLRSVLTDLQHERSASLIVPDAVPVS